MDDTDPTDDSRREADKDLIEELRDAVRARDELVAIPAHSCADPASAPNPRV